MSDSKYTKGNWKITKESHNNSIFIESKETKVTVAKLAYGTFICQADEKEAEANAKLLASAPDLLEALIKMYKLAEDMGIMLTASQWDEKFRAVFNPIMVNTEIVIKKATE